MCRNIQVWPDLCFFVLFSTRFHVPALVPFDSSRKFALFLGICASAALMCYIVVSKLALRQLVSDV